MKLQSFYAAAALPLTLIIFSACIKSHDCGLIREALKLCPIQSLQSFDSTDPTGLISRFTIDYDRGGWPIDMLCQSGDVYSKTDFHFRYDWTDRLTDYIVNFSGWNTAVIWHTYTYPARGFVVDSVFNYGNSSITDPRPEAGNYSYTMLYTLDRYGRIVKEQEAGSSTVTDHKYDNRGNLIRSGVTYDNRINPYQTSLTWMFIFKDYSINNPSLLDGLPIVIDDYNSFGLPLVLQGIRGYGGAGGVNVFGHHFYRDLHISYACDPAKVNVPPKVN